MRLPSGEGTGHSSGPGWRVICRTAPSATRTLKSSLPSRACAASGAAAAATRIECPSGIQAGSPSTSRSPTASERTVPPRAGTRKSCTRVAGPCWSQGRSRGRISRGAQSAAAGGAVTRAVKAIEVPSGAHARVSGAASRCVACTGAGSGAAGCDFEAPAATVKICVFPLRSLRKATVAPSADQRGSQSQAAPEVRARGAPPLVETSHRLQRIVSAPRSAYCSE